MRIAGLCKGKKNKPGQIVAIDREAIIVSCGGDEIGLVIIQIQKAGGISGLQRGEPGINLVRRCGLKIGDILL